MLSSSLSKPTARQILQDLASNEQFKQQRKRHTLANRLSRSLDDFNVFETTSSSTATTKGKEAEAKSWRAKLGRKSASFRVKKSTSSCGSGGGERDRERLRELLDRNAARGSGGRTEILDKCTEFDQKYSNVNKSSNRPEKFPIAADETVELRKSETLTTNRRDRAQTVIETSNTRKCHKIFEGPYKLKAENKTKIKVENGKVEVRDHEIQFYSVNNTILKSECFEGDIEIQDKNINYKTKDGWRSVSFKNPINKQDHSVVDSRNFLRKFLRRRSDKYLLEKKGILKNENVFGNKLSVLKEKSGLDVPLFVRRIIEYIEQDENIKSEHIYRISGNMAVIQKIRLQIDENRVEILDKHSKEIEVLTGTLKLFYRELVDPVLPYKDFEKLTKILDKHPENEDRSRLVVEAIETIDSPHKENLKALIDHLLKIETYNAQNKMTLKSLAIVWGPSVVWYHPDRCPNFSAIDFSILANRVVELILVSHRNLSNLKSVSKSEDPTEAESFRIARSISDEATNSKSKNQKFGYSKGNLRKTESKEFLSGSNWSLPSFGGSESKPKPNENPFYDLTIDSLIIRDNEEVPALILDIIKTIETKPEANDLYITSQNKDYMAKFKKKIGKNKSGDISKMEPLDLAIILVRILRELQEELIPENIFLEFCDNYERLSSDRRRKFVEEKLSNLPKTNQLILTRIMEHLSFVFLYQNRAPIINVWLPVVCNTTLISDQAIAFTKLVFDCYENKAFANPEPEETFEYKIRIRQRHDEGDWKTSFVEEKRDVKSGFSNSQLNSIADSLGKNTPYDYVSKYSKKWKTSLDSSSQSK